MGGFLPKPCTEKEVEDGKRKDSKWTYGVSAMQGWRQGMEDSHITDPDFDPERQNGLFAVFDGHGGSAVAAIVAQRLPDLLRNLEAYKKGDYADALKEVCLKMDEYLDSQKGREEVRKRTAACPDAEEDDEPDMDDISPEMLKQFMEAQNGGREGGEEEMGEGDEEKLEDEDDEDEDMEEEDLDTGDGPDGMGCTSVIALVCGSENQVFCANLGDSRCILTRDSRALAMSRDHKPTNPGERRRIHQAGGFVSPDGRVDGNLNLSRALGDFTYKKDTNLSPVEQKISCGAEIRRRDLTESDHYLVLGCDGIFEKATNQGLIDFLTNPLKKRRRNPDVKLSDICSVFLDHNIAKNPQREQGLGCDNMTLMIVDLKANRTPMVEQRRTKMTKRVLKTCRQSSSRSFVSIRRRRLLMMSRHRALAKTIAQKVEAA